MMGVVVQKWNQIQDVQTSTTVWSLVFKFHILSMEKKTNQIACFETPPPLILCILLQTKTDLQCLLFQEREGCKVVRFLGWDCLCLDFEHLILIAWLEIFSVLVFRTFDLDFVWFEFFCVLMFPAFDLDCLGWNCCLLFWTLDLCLLTLWRTLLSSSTTVQCSLQCRVVSKFVGRMVHWGFQVSILQGFHVSILLGLFFFLFSLLFGIISISFFCVCSSTALRFFVQAVYCRSLWSECVCVWERESSPRDSGSVCGESGRDLQEIVDLVWKSGERRAPRDSGFIAEVWRERERALQEIEDILYCKLKRIYQSWYLLKGLIESLKEAYLLDWQKEEHDANLELWDGPKLKEKGWRE